MENNPKTALLLGANGLVGNYLLFKLLEDARYDSVRVLVRRPLHLKHAKLDERVVDFDRLNRSDCANVDDVFCCLGTTIRQAGSEEAFRKVDFEYPLAVAKLALAGGARQYLLVSSVGADAGSRVFYSRVKGETEAALNGLGFASVQVFRPSMLLGKRREFRLGEEVGKVLALVLTPLLLLPGLRRYRAIEARKVANALLEVANRDEGRRKVWESEGLQAFG